MALRLRNGEVALQQAKGYQEEVARLQAEKEQLSSKVLSEEEFEELVLRLQNREVVLRQARDYREEVIRLGTMLRNVNIEPYPE